MARIVHLPDARYLSMRDAARALGVHPNTVRNWANAGIIRVVRLPGSGYRRVPVTEVQRLLASREP